MVWELDLSRGFAIAGDTLESAKHAAGQKPDYEDVFRNVSCSTDFGSIVRQENRVFLYRFLISKGDPKLVRKKMHEVKKHERTYMPAFPKFEDSELSKVMYVGSSTTNIVARLKQHVGRTPVTTYALKLANWFEAEPDWHADVSVLGFDGLKQKELQILEDIVADHLNPLFGKRGGNGA